MEIQIAGSNNSKLELLDAVFNCTFNESLVHQVVTAYLSAARAGTQAQKTRAEVRGGGVKPWRQKGSGRARAGTIRSPLWSKGGVVFAAKPRSYEQKVNKKMYRGAIRAVMSELVRQNRMIVVDEFTLPEPKTRVFIQELNKLGVKDSVLIITDMLDEKLYLASRNVPNVDVRDVIALDPVALVNADKVIFTVAAIKQIEERLK